MPFGSSTSPPRWRYRVGREACLLKTGALQKAIFHSGPICFPVIATDEKGVIQLFISRERMLDTRPAKCDRGTPADISDPQEVIGRRAKRVGVTTRHNDDTRFARWFFKARGNEDNLRAHLYP